jgi:brefeldin A-inhibited guanine nucleotide-exchange protein
MEPMHPAVITTLHAMCTVISSESKTLKMAEMALECISMLTNGRYVSGVAGGRVKLEVQQKGSDPVVAQQQLSQNIAPGHDGRDGGLSFLGYVIESITRASDLSSEAVQGAMAKALLAIMTCPKCGVHEAAMLQAVRSTFHVYLVGKSPSGKELARRTLVDMLKCVFMRMEAYDMVNKGNNSSSGVGGDVKKEATISQIIKIGEDSSKSATIATTNATAEETDVASTSVGIFASQYHTDSYLLFRALCKLSSKTLPGDENVAMTTNPTSAVGSSMAGSFFSSTPIVDPLALNSKILSLELILAVFEHCGDAFRNGEKFVYAVQSYLCVSLLKNCMSNQTVVAHLSLKIFLLLVSKFIVL